MGDKVGRFLILSELGAGGMGRIYEAYDPELDRRIALKLLHDAWEEGHRQRLVREAQALARLEHPNVVTVHDVGIHQGVLFVAMEFISGGTLKEWAANNPIGSQARFEVAIGLLLDALRGLVAAHEAGLVHRDVKPSNVLIGDDGRARVADFGIAWAEGEPYSRPNGTEFASSDEDLPLSDDSKSRLTRTGVSVGTPAYMAPEQRVGRSVGTPADQFSFCVTAWEVLFGTRPFPGASARERHAAIRRGELSRPLDVEFGVGVVALLERGLRYRASARHPRLADLIDGLGRSIAKDPEVRSRSWWRWAVAVAGVSVAGAGGAYRMARTQQLCTGGAAAFEEVWNEGQRANLRASVLGSELKFAPGAWDRLETGLDAYGEAWRRVYTDACEATKLRGEQLPERMDEQFACLEDAKRSVHALVTLVSSGEVSAIAKDQELLESLPRVEDCKEVRGEPTLAELSMLDAVAQAGAHRSAGQPRRALEIIEPIAKRVDEQTSPIVRARVLLEYGRDLSEASGRRAIEVLSEAHRVAHTARLKRLAAAVARELARQHAVLLGEAGMVRNWLALAKSEGAASSLAEQYEILSLEGMLLSLEGKTQEATSVLERGVEAARADPGLLPHALRLLAENLEHDTARAVEVGREALAQYQVRYGDDHPGAATFEDALAGLLARAGKRDEADTLARRALARSRGGWGEGHAATRRYLVRLADIRCRSFGDTDEGRRLAETALLLHSVHDATPSRYRALLALEGCVRGHHPELVRDVSAERLELSKALYGEEHFRTAHTRAMHAAALVQTSDVEGARTQLLLASAGMDEGAPGWELGAAMHAHRVSATVAAQLTLDELAVEHGEAALNLSERLGAGLLGSGDVQSDQCSSRRAVGELQMALVECLAGLEVVRRHGQRARLATLEYETGDLLRVLHRSREGEEHMQEAVRLAKEVSGPRSFYMAMAQLGLARIKEELGRSAEAEVLYRASLDLFATFSGYHSLVVDSGIGAARAAARLGRFTEALTLLDELAGIAKRRTDVDHAGISQTRGFVLHLQDPRKGAREYERAIKVYRFEGDVDAVRRACEEAPIEVLECNGASANTAEED